MRTPEKVHGEKADPLREGLCSFGGKSRKQSSAFSDSAKKVVVVHAASVVIIASEAKNYLG